MAWLALSLASALSVALTDVYAKKALRDLPAAVVAWARVAFPLPILAAVVVGGGWDTPRQPFWWALAAAVPLEVLASLLYQRALQLSPLGVTAPYLAFTPVFLAFTGRWILGEEVSRAAGAAICLVGVGGYLVQLSPGMGPLGPLRALARESGSLLMLGVAFLYSLTAALGKIAVLHSGPATFAAVYYAAVSLALAPMCLRGPAPRLQQNLRALIPVGAFGAAMILSHFAAIRLAPASYMIAVKRTSLLWSILLGHAVFGEINLRNRLVGGCLMLGGVAVLALAPA